MALPLLAIYAGLKHQEEITFSHRTVQDTLSDLLEQGFVKRVDATCLHEDASIIRVDAENGHRPYYFITDDGREQLSGENR